MFPLIDRTLDQKRAAHALDRVNALEKQAQTDLNDRYAKYAKGLPAMIIMNGLGQAAATLRASDAEENRLLYAHLESWLCRNDPAAPYPSTNSLLDAIVKDSRESYLRAQAEALAWLAWLKKFAQAYLEKPKAAGGGR